MRAIEIEREKERTSVKEWASEHVRKGGVMYMDTAHTHFITVANVQLSPESFGRYLAQQGLHGAKKAVVREGTNVRRCYVGCHVRQ